MSDSEQTEGEHLAMLGISEPFPFRLLIAFAATFPASGDSFWVELATFPKGSPAGELSAKPTEGLTIPSKATFFFNSLRLLLRKIHLPRQGGFLLELVKRTKGSL